MLGENRSGHGLRAIEDQTQSNMKNVRELLIQDQDIFYNFLLVSYFLLLLLIHLTLVFSFKTMITSICYIHIHTSKFLYLFPLQSGSVPHHTQDQFSTVKSIGWIECILFQPLYFPFLCFLFLPEPILKKNIIFLHPKQYLILEYGVGRRKVRGERKTGPCTLSALTRSQDTR